MNYEQLKNSILQEAIEGRLVPQDPSDEPAAVLLQRIREEKARLIKEKKIKKDKNESVIYRNADGHWMERFEDKKRGEVCIDEEIPFEIPETWEWVRLEALCVFLSRGKSPKYFDEDKRFPVFAQKCNLKDGGISLDQARFLDPSTVDKWPKEYYLRNGDVLINSTGTGTVGRTRIFNEDCLGNYPFVVPDSHVSVVRPYKEISSEYLWFVFSSKWGQKYFEDHLAGTTNQKELYIGTLQNTIIPLPPLSEQHRIVSRIEEIMPKVEAYGKAQERLDALNAKLPKDLKNSILQEAIEGRLVEQDPSDEPAAVLLQRIRQEKARLVKEKKIKKDKNESIIYRNADGHWIERFEDKKRGEVCIDDEIPFEIPESWEWTRLGNLCTFLSRGKSPKYFDEDKRYPVFAQKCNLKEGGISLDQARFLDPSTIDKWPKEYYLRNGDVLINSTGTGTVGRTRLFNEDCLGDYPFVVPDSHVSVVRPYKEISSEYLWFVFSSKWGQKYFEDHLAGTTNQKELYIGTLQGTIIPLPPLSEQHRIVAKLASLLPKVERLG